MQLVASSCIHTLFLAKIGKVEVRIASLNQKDESRYSKMVLCLITLAA